MMSLKLERGVDFSIEFVSTSIHQDKAVFMGSFGQWNFTLQKFVVCELLNVAMSMKLYISTVWHRYTVRILSPKVPMQDQYLASFPGPA